ISGAGGRTATPRPACVSNCWSANSSGFSSAGRYRAPSTPPPTKPPRCSATSGSPPCSHRNTAIEVAGPLPGADYSTWQRGRVGRTASAGEVVAGGHAEDLGELFVEVDPVL